MNLFQGQEKIFLDGQISFETIFDPRSKLCKMNSFMSKYGIHTERDLIEA